MRDPIQMELKKLKTTLASLVKESHRVWWGHHINKIQASTNKEV